MRQEFFNDSAQASLVGRAEEGKVGQQGDDDEHTRQSLPTDGMDHGTANTVGAGGDELMPLRSVAQGAESSFSRSQPLGGGGGLDGSCTLDFSHALEGLKPQQQQQQVPEESQALERSMRMLETTLGDTVALVTAFPAAGFRATASMRQTKSFAFSAKVSAQLPPLPPLLAPYAGFQLGGGAGVPKKADGRSFADLMLESPPQTPLGSRAGGGLEAFLAAPGSAAAGALPQAEPPLRLTWAQWLLERRMSLRCRGHAPAHGEVLCADEAAVSSDAIDLFACAALVISFFMFNPTATNVLHLFSCISVDTRPELNPLPDTSVRGTWLLQDVNQRCYEGAHARYLVGVGLPGVIVVCAGMPLLVFFLIFRNRNRLTEQETLARLGFLCHGAGRADRQLQK